MTHDNRYMYNYIYYNSSNTNLSLHKSHVNIDLFLGFINYNVRFLF